MDNANFPIATGTCKYARDITFDDLMIGQEKLAAAKAADMAQAVRFSDDFLNYTAGDYTVTETGSGSRAMEDLPNGVLLITNAAADNDVNELCLKTKNFQLKTGFPGYWEIKVRLSDVLQSDFWFGLVDLDEGLFQGSTVGHGVYFRKDDGSAALLGSVENDGTVVDTTMGVNMVNATWYVLGIHWDGFGTVRFMVFADGVYPQVCSAIQAVTTGYPTGASDYLTLGFGIRNGEAVAKTLRVDYLRGAQKRIV